jgi:ribosomal protein L13E
MGFKRTKSRDYSVEVEKEEIDVPLRDFRDAEEIENKQEEFAIKIWVSPTEETQTYEAIVLKLPAELPQAKPKTQQVITPPPPKPEAEVKSPRGKRKGRGFSKREIISAGLIMEDVRHLHIPYDKRRKSSHLWNIIRLKSITER